MSKQINQEKCSFVEKEIYEVYFKDGTKKIYRSVIEIKFDYDPVLKTEFLVIEQHDELDCICAAKIDLSLVAEYRSYKDILSYNTFRDADVESVGDKTTYFFAISAIIFFICFLVVLTLK